MARVILVGCGKSKAAAACKARDLYTGNLFSGARDYAEGEVTAGRATAWFILSAKHGLLAPDTVVAPYDTKLSKAEASTWGAGVFLALKRRFRTAPGPTDGSDLPELVILAGETYAAPLVAYLSAPAAPFEPTIPAFHWPRSLPLTGAEVGERLAWFKARREEQVVERQRAAKVEPRAYIGTDFDRELLPCPVCLGDVQGIPMCFEPMGKLGADRWRSLDAGTYHRARVPVDVLARSEKAAADLRARLIADQVDRDHAAALAEGVERAHREALLEDSQRAVSMVRADLARLRSDRIRTKAAPLVARSVPIVCCSLAVITLMAGRPIEHVRGCSAAEVRHAA